MSTLTAHAIPERILFGRSEAMREVQKAVHKVCGTPVPVLLQGEMGTGKEVIGQRIHLSSPWRSGPFTKLDARGASRAYAQTATPNWETLSRLLDLPQPSCGDSPGTLFIDEIGDLASPLQAKLLDFFRECPAGQSKSGTINPASPRILCSSRRDVEQDVIAGHLRQDLFYRINVVTIQIPRLRDRKEDITGLAMHFYEAFCAQGRQRCPRFPSELLVAFREYDWPGNIRELENCVNTYVNSNGDVAITEALLSKRPLAGGNRTQEAAKKTLPLRTYTRQITAEAEREVILKVLNETRWNRKDAAKALQISYHTLLHKLKQTALNRKRKPSVDSKENPVPGGRWP
jgi:DNA-binding NtrC family response regulator